MKILHLVLKEKWYNMIKCGEKKEEYREITPYWATRILSSTKKENWGDIISDCSKNHDLISKYGVKGFTHVCFHLGYTNETITFCIENITEDKGNENWGAEKDKYYFVIKLGKRQ